jgi:hypothetical protein
MNLTDLKTELRAVEKMGEHERFDHFELLRGQPRRDRPPLVEWVHCAIHQPAADFRRHLAELPAWTLRFVRARIARSAYPRIFSTTKLKTLDVRIRQFEASLCCPWCGKKFTAPGLPGHVCRTAPEVEDWDGEIIELPRRLTAREMMLARNLAGLPESARLAKSLEFEPRIGLCLFCGCSEQDCSGCIERTGEPCHWAEMDLCSACVIPSLAGRETRLIPATGNCRRNRGQERTPNTKATKAKTPKTPAPAGPIPAGRWPKKGGAW